MQMSLQNQAKNWWRN